MRVWRPRTICLMTKLPLIVFVLGGTFAYARWSAWRAQNRLMGEIVFAIRSDAPPKRAAMIEGREQVLQFLDALHEVALTEPPESDMAKAILNQIERSAHR